MKEYGRLEGAKNVMEYRRRRGETDCPMSRVAKKKKRYGIDKISKDENRKMESG